MNLRTSCALALAILLPCALPAAPAPPGEMLAELADLSFDNLGSKQGLPHDSVYGFVQDSTGFLWIATFGGLARFDGYRMRTYVHDPDDPASLPDNNIRVIVLGDDGKLWIGTGNAGVIQYDPQSDSFRPAPNLPQVLSKSRVFAMAPDGEGGVWFGTELGLTHYDARCGTYESFGRGGQQPFPLGKVFSVFVDHERTLWAGGENGLVQRRAGTAAFEQVLGLPGDAELGERPPVWAIFEDRSDRIWIGSDVTGVGIYDPAAVRIRGVPGLAGRQSLIGAHTVRGFIETEPGEIWIATYGGGLITADVKRNVQRRWLRNPMALAPIANNFIRSIYRDRSGVVWLGTDNGLSKTNAAARGILHIYTSLLRGGDRAAQVRSLAASGGRIWVGFDQGDMSVIEPGGTVRPIRPAPWVLGAQRSRREVLAMKVAGDGAVFAGGAGLFAIDPHTLTYKPVPDPLLENQVINALYVEGDLVWAATYKGLVRYDRREQRARLFSHDPADPGSIADNYVRDLLETPDGRLWITTRLGLDILDPARGVFHHIRHDAADSASIASDNVQPILRDADGRIWVGTIGSGLTVLSSWPAGGEPRFRTLDRKSGFPDGIVLTLAQSQDGRIWANTPGGLATIDPHTFRAHTYLAADGLRTTAQNLFSSVALEDGTVLFPGNSGIIAARSSLLKPWAYRAPLALTELHTVDPGDMPASLVPSILSRGLRLGASSRGFDAEFALLDYTGSESTRYFYKLSGFDPDWSETTADRRIVKYTNLPPGKYELLLRAMSRMGAGPSATMAVPIEALPAWHEMSWFLAARVAAIIACILGGIRIRTAVLRRRQRELEREVAERTLELEEKRAELLQSNRRLSFLATHDPLSGLLNRRHFLDLAEIEIARSLQSGRPFALFLADVDHFKRVNDTHGHLVGDAVIKALAGRFSETLRATDVLARYGGEELIALLPETDDQAALILAERLRRAIESRPVAHEQVAVQVTVSIGIAYSTGDEKIDAVVERADKALYTAKNEGRNRIVVGGHAAPYQDRSADRRIGGERRV